MASACQPLAFFSWKLWNNERKYSVFDQELLATHHLFSARPLLYNLLYIAHKPLTFAMSKVTEPWSA